MPYCLFRQKYYLYIVSIFIGVYFLINIKLNDLELTVESKNSRINKDNISRIDINKYIAPKSCIRCPG